MYKNNPSEKTHMKYIHKSTRPGFLLASLNCELRTCLDQQCIELQLISDTQLQENPDKDQEDTSQIG